MLCLGLCDVCEPCLGKHGFLRVRCDTCHAEHLVAFRRRRHGVCRICRARRMAESAALIPPPRRHFHRWHGVLALLLTTYVGRVVNRMSLLPTLLYRQPRKDLSAVLPTR